MSNPDNNPREIDLPPNQWRSERPKPHEPFWGAGWKEQAAYLIGLAISVSVVYYVLH